MALDTYANLKLTIADYLDRDDLTSQIDDFIDLTEARHDREIRIREMQRRATATASARRIALPASFLEMQTLRILTDPVTILTEVNLHEINRVRSETTGKPKFYTLHEEIEFDVTPDSSYTVEMVYYASLTALDATNTINALLTRAPDLYLYGSLVAASPFLLDDERISVWESLYVNAKDTLTLADRRNRHGGPLVSRVSGATP